MITEEQIKFWLGSNVNVDECIDVIKSIANEDYQPKHLKNDIIETWEGCNT
jgi:hypothetical protein